MTSKRIYISCIVAAIVGMSLWSLLSGKTISKREAQKIAAQALIGKPHYSGNVPVNVEDRGTSYAVFFTHPVPGGQRGDVYQSFAVIDKQSGEVLEIGVTSPNK